jgi:hypothetical protein
VTRFRLLSLIVLLALSAPACVLTGGKDATPDSIVGTYLLNGVDPTGAEYAGHLFIQSGEGPGEYRLQWIVNGIQEGVGTLDGDRLEVSWATVSGVDPSAHGKAEFELQPDGSLVGTRTIVGVDAVGTEEAFPNDDVPD